MPNTKIVDELAKIPRLEGESKAEWLFRAKQTWMVTAIITRRFPYSTVAWDLVLTALLEAATELHVSRICGGYVIDITDGDWLWMIRAHDDEVVALADELMPQGFRKITRDEIRWILNTLGKHIAES